MPPLTRRRSKDDPHRKTWLIYLGDVRIGRRAGVPTSAPQWGWSCGFYPGINPGEHRTGTAETLDDARAAFQGAWVELAATLTEAAYEMAASARLDRLERQDACSSTPASHAARGRHCALFLR
jgi:hypothetical protein